MKTKPFIIGVVFFLMSWQTPAQDYSREGVTGKLVGLTDQQKVKFINEHFYKIYSADFDYARELARWAVDVSMKNKWKEEEAYAQLCWGVITFLSGDYQQVLPKYFRSRELFDSLSHKKGLAAINNEMAVFYHKQKDVEKAYQCLDASERFARETNDLLALGTSLAHRGAFLSVKGKYQEAKPYYEEVYRIRLQTNDSVGLGYVLCDLAEISVHEGDLNKALRFIDQSTVIRTAIGDVQGVAINHVNKGEHYFNQRQFQNAANEFQAGLKQSLAIGFDDLSRHTYDYLGKTYLELKDYKHAYELQEKSVAFKDSLFNIDRSRVIQELQTKYETEKKDREISDLNKDNRLKAAVIERTYFLVGGLVVLLLLGIALFYLWRYRARQQQLAVLNEQKMRMREAQITAVIDSQEKERRRFASDLHDGMGQLISALQLNIQSLKQSANNPEKRYAFFESSEQLINEVHDEIRNIAFNLMPPVLVKEGLVPAVEELVRKINKTGKIKATISVFDLKKRFGELAEISLYRIIQEFLSNIMKYSNATEITISFTGHDHEVSLTIDDNGMGYNLEKFKVSEGNGWRNINSRLNLIHATIEFDIVEGRKNNTIMISIPHADDQQPIRAMQNTEHSV